MRWLKRLAIALFILAALLTAGYFLFCRWLKSELERQIEAATGAEVTIGDLALSLPDRAIVLTEVVALRPGLGRSEQGVEDIDLTVERALVVIDLELLRRRVFRIEHLILERPVVKASIRLPEPVPAAVQHDQLRRYFEERRKLKNNLPLAFPVGRLEVLGGRAELSFSRPGAEPIPVEISRFRYSIPTVVGAPPISLLADAELWFELEGGGVFEKRPGRVAASGVDFAALSALLAPAGSLRFSAGALDLDWQGGDAEVRLRGLKLEGARFLPEAAAGDFRFSLALPDGPSTRGDIDYLAVALWSGIWSAVIAGIEEPARLRLVDEAAATLRSWLERLPSELGPGAL
jgi:hypothetical protein